MPRQSTATEARITNITECLTPAITLLKELNDAFAPPFIEPLANTTLALITGIEHVKRNKDDCLQLLENIHQVLYAIVILHMKYETVGALPPAVLEDIGQFTETLHKIYTFVTAQQNGNKLKQFLRQSERKTLYKECLIGVDHAVQALKVQSSTTFSSINEMKRNTEHLHKDLLEMISAVSDGTASDRSSSVYQGTNSSKSSSKSFSMLPARPKIFHGRQSELEDIQKVLALKSPRVAILGGGGMGKTSLARAVLHDPDTCMKFHQRYFVSAESATTSIELAALVGLHLGLNPVRDLTRSVVQCLSRQPPCLLILDNLETPWEPMQSRSGIEEFLSLLTDIEHIALMITMRGAERPAKVAWTRPFLAPLGPLPYDAAQQMFNDITDDSDDSEEKAQLLRLTDNMPLAVDLIAHLVDYEGLSNVLARWKTEKTSLLSAGYDRKSNLDASIAISVSSPRVTSGAKELLSLLSILPDGLADFELIQSNLPIPNIQGCKSALLATALAYTDDRNRLRSLMPIREHIQCFSSPSQGLTQSMRGYYHSILALYNKHNGAQKKALTTQITLNLANLQEVLKRGLQPNYPDLADTIRCAMQLNCFHRVTMSSSTILIDAIPHMFPHLRDHRLEVAYITEKLSTPAIHKSISAPEVLVSEAISHLQNLNDPVLESKFYVALAGFSADYHSDRPKSLHFLHKALGLSQTCGDIKSHCAASLGIAHTKWEIGDYAGAMAHATEAQRLGILSGNLYDEAHALQFLAMCSISLGNYSYGLAQLQRAREIIGICGMTGGSLDHSITNLFAEVHLQKSEYAEARNFYSAIIQNTSMDHDIDSYAFTLGNIAGVDIQLGASTQDIHKNLETAKQIFRSIGFEYGRMSCGMIAADLELREGNIISASSLFQASLQWAWGNSSEMVSFCLERLADISRWGGTQLHAPSNWQMVYLGYAKKSEEKLALHKALLLLGDFFLAKSDECTAQSLFTVALEGFTYMDVHQGRAQCMQRLGDLVNKRGDPLKAVDLWMAAQLLFHRSSQAKDVSLIDARLAAAKEAHQRGLTHLTNLSAPAIPPQSLNSKEGESFKIAALVHKPLGEEKAMVSM